MRSTSVALIMAQPRPSPEDLIPVNFTGHSTRSCAATPVIPRLASGAALADDNDGARTARPPCLCAINCHLSGASRLPRVIDMVRGCGHSSGAPIWFAMVAIKRGAVMSVDEFALAFGHPNRREPAGAPRRLSAIRRSVCAVPANLPSLARALAVFGAAGLITCSAIPARAAVGPSGSNDMSIPIVVPPYHGLEPSLRIAYQSGTANGWLGVGWVLSGVSAIQRSSPGKGLPNYDDTDDFYLDGLQLIRCTEGSPSPSCKYPPISSDPNLTYIPYTTKVKRINASPSRR